MLRGARDDPLGHLALEHQRHRLVEGWPGLGAEPADQERRRDVVREIGDDAGGALREVCAVDLQRVAGNDGEAAGVTVGNFLQRGQAARVALNGDDTLRARGEQRPGQPAGTGADLDDRDPGKVARRTRDAGGQVEVEEEVLAERLVRGQAMAGDHLAERRQIVHPRYAAPSFRWSSAASLSAAARLDGSAMPLPAMSKAVPWSGEVRTKARPRVTLTVSANARVLAGISA